MYDFVDRPVTSLDPGGRFLVWAMRSWVHSLHGQRCPAGAIAPAFARWKMIAGLPHFHTMMLLLNHEALEDLSFGPLPCNRVREHEALVISLIYGMRMSRPVAVRKTLALVVNDAAVTDLMTAVCALGRAMSDAAIFPDKPALTSQIGGS